MNNIALVVLDTLRKDAFDQYFDWLPGIRFENAWSTSHWTVPVHASMFTGRYAIEAGVYARTQHLDYEGQVLPEVLTDSGYRTRAYSANPNISRMFDFDRGFTEFEGSRRVKPFNDSELFNWEQFLLEKDDVGLSDYLAGIKACIVQDKGTVRSIKNGIELKFGNRLSQEALQDDGAHSALQFLQSTEFEPNGEFLFLNLMEAHGPYAAPEEYRTVEPPAGFNGIVETINNSELDPNRIRCAYHDCVRYLSDIYKEIFEEIRTDFDYVITLSDHGELFGEKGAWKHDYGLMPELVNIPFCITTPDGHSKTRDDRISLIDLFQTVCDVADIDQNSRGSSVLNEGEATEYLTEYHGITNDTKLEKLRSMGYSEKTIEFYDRERYGLLRGDEYYGFEHDDSFLEIGHTDIESPQTVLKQVIDLLDVADVSREELGLDESTKNHLEELGYL